jgi:hypothetical protein
LEPRFNGAPRFKEPSRWSSAPGDDPDALLSFLQLKATSARGTTSRR